MATAARTTTAVPFKYVARDADGKKVRGVIHALSPRGAKTALMERALEPVKVGEKTGLNIQLAPKKVRPTDLMHLSRQLSAFTRAGIPILDAIAALAEGSDNETLQRTLLDLNDALRSGVSFAGSLEEHPKVFPSYYRGIIRAAEHTGNLDVALDELAVYLEREVDARRKITSAMTYPGLIIIMAMITIVVLALFVMPRFESFFDSLGAELPLPTRMLRMATQFVMTWWWALVGGFVGIAAAFTAGRKTPKGQVIIDRIMLRLPAIGPTVHLAVVERFCRTLGSMVQSGVPLPDALQVAADGTNNTVYKERLREAHDEMVQGAGIAGPLTQTGLFPTAATQMFRAGEETGTLDQQLRTAANYYELELDHKIKGLTSMFEPAVMIFVGLVVGFVAVALVSAMYGVLGTVS